MIKATFELSEEGIETLLCSMASGSAYWCEGAIKLGNIPTIKRLMKGGVVTLKDIQAEGDETRTYYFNLKSLERGLQTIVSACPYQFGQIVNDETDQETADCLLQYSLFGEVKYS